MKAWNSYSLLVFVFQIGEHWKSEQSWNEQVLPWGKAVEFIFSTTLLEGQLIWYFISYCLQTRNHVSNCLLFLQINVKLFAIFIQLVSFTYLATKTPQVGFGETVPHICKSFLEFLCILINKSIHLFTKLFLSLGDLIVEIILWDLQKFRF